jgi:hypothetical protein
MLRKTLPLLGALLMAFHVWLFVGQVWDGQFANLALASRWIIAAGLIAGLVNLHRRGVSVIRGRRPVAIWLVAAILHGPALARDVDVNAAIPEVVATIARVAAGLTILGVVLLIGVAGLRRRDTSPLRALAVLDTPIQVGARSSRSYLRFAPRPPPIA